MNFSHKEEHSGSSLFIRDIVIGMSDGLTVPFALAAGLSGAVDNNQIILTAGFAEIAAGSIAMGLGGFLAGSTEMEHYNRELQKEYFEVDNMPEKEKEEVKDILKDYGLSTTSQQLIVDELSKDKDKWVDFMMKFELGMDRPDKNRAKVSGLTIAIAYVVGGIIPLSGYFFSALPLDGLKLSIVITLLALFVFGFTKNRILNLNPWKGAWQVCLTGLIASLAAYLIAGWIS